MNYSKVTAASMPGAAQRRGEEAGVRGAQDWLIAQCGQLPEVRAGLVLQAQDGVLAPAALWPNATGAGLLLELTERAGREARGLITALTPAEAEGPNYAIAYPIRRDDMVLAVAALAVRIAGEEALQGAMRRLQWGAAGLELILTRHAAQEERERVETLEESIDLLSVLLAEPRFEGAAMAFVTGLATRLGADRVSLGFLKDGACKVRHMSHSSQFDKRMNLVRLIEAAMDEAVDQRRPVMVPAAEAPDVIGLAHEKLTAQEPGAAMTLPLYIDGEPVGALTAERPPSQPFSESERRTVESLSALAIAALEEKRQNDRPLPAKLWAEGRRLAGVVLRPGRPEYRIGLGLGLLALLFLLLARGADNLSADAVLSPQQQRILAAPFDGYVRSAPARAGDHVRKGQVLAALDDSDLKLERAKWLSQLSRYGGLYQDAAATADRVQTGVNSAQRDEAQAQLDLTDALIARAVLRAPFDGLVVSGDLSQRIGGSVTKGEVLFTVAPAGNYRVDLDIKESRIAALRVGQHGLLHLSALPSRPYRFTVRKITPKTVAQNGATYFVIEAVLDPGQSLAQLQPGMEGIGKVDVGTGWLLGIWTRDLTEWVRLKLWGLFG
jgi:RND family efflux transporter MFP subunit